MVGVSQIEIHESCSTLQSLLREQVTLSSKERIHALYLLKSGAAANVTHAARLLCRSRVTLQRWLKKYEQGGIAALLAPATGQGCKSKVPAVVQQALESKLATAEGFGSYGEVQAWLAARGVDLTYGGTHYYVHYYLGASLKVPRPCSLEQDPQRVALFKTVSPPNWP